MPDPFVLPRLYPILDAGELERRRLEPLDVALAWLDAGVALFQLRAKRLVGGAYLELARKLAVLADAHNTTFIVNDRADIARLSGAAGVHLGQEDLSPNDVRPLVGRGAVVGLSTHNERQLTAALQEPVDYVAIGPVFPTTSKANPDPVVGLAGVERAARLARARGVPLVAIGGIGFERAAEVLGAGASSVAVISGLLDGVDPRRRAQQFMDTLAGLQA